MFGSIGQAFSNAVQWTGDTAKSAGTAISNGASVAWDKTTTAASNAWDATKQATSDAWDATKQTASDAAQWTSQKASDAADWTKQKATAVANGAADFGAAGQAGYQLTQSKKNDVPLTPPVGKSDYSRFGKWPKVEKVRDDGKPITVTIPFKRSAQGAATAAATQTGQGATLQAPGGSFLYLDVGRWGGTRDNPTRDFGIVCGRTAAICHFTKGSAGSYPTYPGSKTKLEKGPKDEIDPINALLGKLAGGDLGTPQVRHYLTAKQSLPAGTESIASRIYVILGDMHLPTVTELKPGAALPAGTVPKEQTELGRRRVGRNRRVDNGKDEDIMSDDDATSWHERYVAAEIFQEAGPDLRSLISLLKQAQGNVGAELWLLQLGDMFDLWLGFDCFLTPSPAKSEGKPGEFGQVIIQDTPVRPAPIPIYIDGQKIEMQDPMIPTPNATTGTGFVDIWVARTLDNTTQGEYVKTFLTYDNHHSAFLYGNHDNYLRKEVPSVLANLSGGQYSPYYHWAPSFLYACHGHQFDDYNRDGAVTGNMVTQAAFWGGQLVRKAEDLSDSREPTILGAAQLFREGKLPFFVFAMGHTHVALLAEVVNVMAPEPKPAEPMPIMIMPPI